MSRNILSPDLLPMGTNRCYRVNAIHEEFGEDPRRAAAAAAVKTNYVEQDLYADDDEDDDTSGAFKVEELPNGAFMLTMPVASAFYGGIIGLKGASRRRLESETLTEITVPPRITEGHLNKSENVVIKGQTRSAVCAARRKINLLIFTLRERMRPTHFVSVPLETDALVEHFNNFKRDVLACNLPGIDESLFILPGCLHQTLVTCCLLNGMERAQGVDVLKSCNDFLQNITTPLNIKIHGLEIMNDDPSAVRILYAVVVCEDLQQLADKITERFKKKGLSSDKRNYDHVKLHMTIMNMRYNAADKKQGTRDTFDAREILKRFADYDFGTVKCNGLRLCAMRSEGDSREYYKVTGTLEFPKNNK